MNCPNLSLKFLNDLKYYLAIAFEENKEILDTGTYALHPFKNSARAG